MLRDAERVDRFTQAVGTQRLTDIAQEWIAIANGRPYRRGVFRGVAGDCRATDVPPEAMLVAVRLLSRAQFDYATTEGQRVEEAWIEVVRVLMEGYYSPT